MAKRKKVGRKKMFTNKQFGIGLLVAIALMYLPLGGFISTLGEVLVLVIAILLLLK